MHRFQNILLYTGTQQNASAICRAVELAIENSAKLTFMDVVPHVSKAVAMLTNIAPPSELEALVAKDHRDRLLQMASEYSDTGITIDVVVSTGKPAEEIVRRVVREQYDLVLKAADGNRRIGQYLGGVAHSLLRTCPCPVWILKPDVHGKFDHVLATIDMDDDDPVHSELNQSILEMAHSIASRERAELRIVSVCDLWMEAALRRRAGDQEIDLLIKSRLDQTRGKLHQLLKQCQVQVPDDRILLPHGNPATMIHSVATENGTDLIVMGTVCRTGIAGFLIGNTAEQLLGRVDCSVLALKPTGFESPIQPPDENTVEWPDKFPLV